MEELYPQAPFTEEEATAFVGKNTDFYLTKWESHPTSTLKGWNWAASLFRVEWMVYRKMYWEAAVVWGISIIIMFLVDLLFTLIGLSILGELSVVVVQISLGIFANALYQKKLLRVLKKTEYMNEHSKMEYLAKKGGTSVLAIVVLGVLEILFYYGLLMFA